MITDIINPEKPKKTILIVEDDESFIEQLTLHIHSSNYKLIVERDGYRALKMLKAIKVDVAIIDLGLPLDIQGIDLLTEIKSNPALCDIECIILTAEDDPQQRTACTRFDAFCYLVKCHETLTGLEILIKRAIERQESIVEIFKLNRVIKLLQIRNP